MVKKIINFSFSERTFYSIILIAVVVLGLIGVYAYTNPSTGVGHDITEVGAPASCTAGQVLSWNGGNWNCTNNLASLPSCSSNNQILIYNSTSSSWECANTFGNKIGGDYFYLREGASTCFSGDTLIEIVDSSVICKINV